MHNQLKPQFKEAPDNSHEPEQVESQLEEAPVLKEEAILQFGETGNFEPSQRKTPSRPGKEIYLIKVLLHHDK